MKVLRCCKCEKCIGEIDFDAEVVYPQCGNCANLLPQGEDKLAYTITSLNNQKKEKLITVTY